jgi:regulatory protein
LRRVHGIAIRLPSGFHSVRNIIALASQSFFAFIDPLAGGLLEVGAALFEVIRALAGFVLDYLAGFLAGFRGEEHADTYTNAQSEQKAGKSVLVHMMSSNWNDSIKKTEPVRLISSILRMSMHERRVRFLDAASLWEYALKVLAGRAHSAGELREKLRRRAQRAEDVDDVLSRLKQSGYLDDKRYAESYAAARLSGEKFGRTRVIHDLRQHRVAPALAEHTVEKVYKDVDEVALIEEWIRRKYRTATREGLFAEEKDLAAAYRRLVRAGFRNGEILKVLKRFARNPDLLDGFEPPEDDHEA